MIAFNYNPLPSKVLFGSGRYLALLEEAERFEASRILILSTPQQKALATQVGEVFGARAVEIFSQATMHTPVDVTLRALKKLESFKSDLIVSVGGGSTIGLGKALSVRTGINHIAVPTTYAGSEMTPILGETENGVKTTRRDPAILPEVAIYDVDLTLGLPVDMTMTSGVNALAHCVEALYAHDGNPIITINAAEAIRALTSALPQILLEPRDIEARTQALYGAWLAGTCLGSVSMSIHHKLCHTLGGSLNLPHAETHTIILPYATAYVAQDAPEAMSAIVSAMGTQNAALGLKEFTKSISAPQSLSEIGMTRDDLDRVTDMAVQNSYPCPRPIERDAIRNLLEKAFEGAPPINI